MKNIKPILLAAALAAAGFAAQAQTKVYTDEEFQTALTDAANNGSSDSEIDLYSTVDPFGGSSTLGYYTGSFNYNSVAGVGLKIVAAGPGPITIDGGGIGRGLNITGTTGTTGVVPDPGNITVSGITFVRNCGSYQIGALRIAAGSGATITVSDCQFLSLSTNGGMGLEIVSGDNAYIENCQFIGKTTSSTGGTANYDGDGLSIAGVLHNTLLSGLTISGNYQGLGAYITSSAVLNVFSNTFQGNTYGALYFNPSSSSKIAQVVVVTNVFSTNGGNYGGAVTLDNFDTLFLATNLIEGNLNGGVAVETGVMAATVANTFVGNTGGGGVFVGLTTNVVSANTFIGNSGGSYGGAYFEENTTNAITGNTFTGNISTSGGAGAAYCYYGSYFALSNNTFTANQAKNGPGGALQIVNSGSAFVTVSGNTFTGNSCIANNTGGALYISGVPNLITLNTFELNSSADGGGAIADTAPAMTLTDNLLVQNSQAGGAATGGALYLIPSASLYMINNTITSNTSAGGGGGVAVLPNGTGNFDLYNNIIFGNVSTGGSGYDAFFGGTGSTCIISNNDINDFSGNPYGHNNINADPKFYDPINGDYHLQCCATPVASPCLNTGDAQAPSLPATDLDGNPRLNPSSQVDIGCYELNTTAFHPADTAQLSTITLGEYYAYSNYWKIGATWSVPPNPIPANYVTRAGYLYLNDTSTYYNDGSDRPTNWKPTSGDR